MQSEDSWVTSWKSNYWRPWCVARTAPLRCLMNLYQDFGSYKLKEECTWLVGSPWMCVLGSLWADALYSQHPAQARCGMP